MASTSGLACILVGLQKAPQIKQSKNRIADIININNVLAVVIPTTCLGGVPILQAEKYNIPVIALEAKVRTLLNAEIQSGITSDFLLTRSAILRLLYCCGREPYHFRCLSI